MRLRNNPNAFSELEKTKYLIKEYPYRISTSTVIELGMGKGDMITKMAKLNPSKNYIGIERFATVANIARKRAEELSLDNFKIIVDDISKLSDLLVGKTKTIWLTFSDPWPKARHAKRRLTHINFLNIYKNFLDEDGVIKFKTDNDKFFEWTVEHFQENNIQISNLTRDLHSQTNLSENIMTEYEKKWSNNGKKINYLEARF